MTFTYANNQIMAGSVPITLSEAQDLLHVLSAEAVGLRSRASAQSAVELMLALSCYEKDQRVTV